MMEWYFSVQDDVVFLDARLEDDDGMIGDARTEVHKGEKFYGVSYDDLVAAGDGLVVVEGEKGSIVEDEPD